MAFIFARNLSGGKTWYVGYYVDGKFVLRKVDRSKAVAQKELGDIEAELAKGRPVLSTGTTRSLSFSNCTI